MSQDQPVQPLPIDRLALPVTSLRSGVTPAMLTTCCTPCICFSDSDED